MWYLYLFKKETGLKRKQMRVNEEVWWWKYEVFSSSRAYVEWDLLILIYAYMACTSHVSVTSSWAFLSCVDNCMSGPVSRSKYWLFILPACLLLASRLFESTVRDIWTSPKIPASSRLVHLFWFHRVVCSASFPSQGPGMLIWIQVPLSRGTTKTPGCWAGCKVSAAYSSNIQVPVWATPSAEYLRLFHSWDAFEFIFPRLPGCLFTREQTGWR